MIRRAVWMAVGAIVALWGRRHAIDTAERYVPLATRARLAPAQQRVLDFSKQVTNRLGAEMLFALRAYVRAKRAALPNQRVLLGPRRDLGIVRPESGM